jgi:YebC/PmpR family DNA-binding regulatory protein
MAGHSKWANIKHKKSKADAQKGKVFTKISKEIIIAAKEGGGDPAGNFRLKLAVQKAKEANMPNDNIERAIKRGTGEIDGGNNFEEIVYEGYGPAGVAVMLDIMTDNRNRTASEIRYLFSRNGGSLGETGCVAWMFDKKGYLLIDRTETPVDEDELMMVALDLGADDVKTDDDSIEIFTEPSDLSEVKQGLEEMGYVFSVAEVSMIPQNTIELNNEQAKQMLKLMEALEDQDDVQNVYANFDIPEEIMNELEE